MHVCKTSCQLADFLANCRRLANWRDSANWRNRQLARSGQASPIGKTSPIGEIWPIFFNWEAEKEFPVDPNLNERRIYAHKAHLFISDCGGKERFLIRAQKQVYFSCLFQNA